MKHRRSNQSQKAEILGRLTSGESIPSVARAYGCFPNAIRRMQVLTGGAKPRAQTIRQCALSLAEREEISRSLALQLSCRAIAARLGRAPSTIARSCAGMEADTFTAPIRRSVALSGRRCDPSRRSWGNV